MNGHVHTVVTVCLFDLHLHSGIPERGAGGINDFVDLFREIPDIDAGLAASIFHFGEVAIPDLKRELRKNNITVRL